MQLYKRKTRLFLKAFFTWLLLNYLLLTLPGPVLAMLLAAQGNAMSRQGGVRARTMWKDSIVRGEVLLPMALFQE